MNNVVNQIAFLRTSREFPEELHQLTVEVNKSYLDIAQAVNNRIIGIFSVNRPAITGESWFLRNQRQQTLRRVFTFTGTTLTIAHGLDIADIGGFTRIYGTFTNGTNMVNVANWFPLPYVDVTAANNQVNVTVNPTNIVITRGGGAGAPVIQSGIVVLEWLSQV